MRFSISEEKHARTGNQREKKDTRFRWGGVTGDRGREICEAEQQTEEERETARQKKKGIGHGEKEIGEAKDRRVKTRYRR